MRSAQVNIMEDEINIMPAPYSAPDAYYFPITGKMHAVEVLKGTSQYRYGPHSTGGAMNFVTTPIDFGQGIMEVYPMVQVTTLLLMITLTMVLQEVTAL